ncbi:MAG TPA: nickel-dependent lactate racemase [Acidobacteriota bacterium]|jgi:nickel-dependent lactate racemase
MLIELAYGRSGLSVDLPGEATVIEPAYIPGLHDECLALQQALRNPVAGRPLRELVASRQRIAIAVCDITRPMPSARVLPLLLNEISHVPSDRIAILVATGTHRGNTPAELEAMLGREVTGRYSVINHDGRDEANLAFVGRTERGIPIWLNRRWMEADFRITTGFIEPHFFAGFSGGPKMVAPGLAGLETVMHLHGADLIAHPDSTWGITQGNPIHDSIREIARRTAVHFSVDITINRDHRITGVYAGELFQAHAAGCLFAKETAMRPVPDPFHVVVTTNSGYPLDLNLYQAVKGMSAAARVVAQGGTIICAAECSNGIPDHGEYGKILRSGRSPADLLAQIQMPGYRRQDQWQVQVQAMIQQKARVLFKNSFLSTEQVRSAHLEPIDDVPKAVQDSLREHGAGSRLCVLPQGPMTIPYLRRLSA